METNPSEIFKKLAEPFLPEDLEWRVGVVTGDEPNARGIALAYITARAVMQRLDEVVGPENWKDEYVKGPDGGVLCGLSIRINGEWVTKWDGAENTDFEAVKGGLSDAFKRAGVKWGIGRYLYRFPEVWCKVVKRGRSWVLAERPAVPEWAYPSWYLGDKEHGMINLIQTQSASQPAPKAQKPAQPEPQAQEKPNGNGNGAVQATIERAKAYRIPAGLPFEGETVGEAIEKGELGKKVVLYLAGIKPNKKGEIFTPQSEEDQKLKSACAYLVAHLKLETE